MESLLSRSIALFVGALVFHHCGIAATHAGERASSDKPVLRPADTRRITPAPNAVAWSPDSRLIAGAGGARTVFVWDARRLSVVQELDVGERGGGRDHVAFSPDGHLLASGLSTVSLWDTEHWTLLRKLVAPHITAGAPQAIAIRGVAFNSTGSMLAVAYGGAQRMVVAFRTDDGTALWKYKPEPQLEGSRGSLITTGLVIAKDDAFLAVGITDYGRRPDGDPARASQIVMLSPVSGAVLRRIRDIHVDAVTALAVNPDGSAIATGTSTGTVSDTANLKTGKTVHLENRDPIRIWRASDGKLIGELAVGSRVWGLAFTADGSKLFASRSDVMEHSTLVVFQIPSRTVVQTLVAWPSPIGLAVRPDGKQLVTVGEGALSVYDIAP